MCPDAKYFQRKEKKNCFRSQGDLINISTKEAWERLSSSLFGTGVLRVPKNQEDSPESQAQEPDNVRAVLLSHLGMKPGKSLISRKASGPCHLHDVFQILPPRQCCASSPESSASLEEWGSAERALLPALLLKGLWEVGQQGVPLTWGNRFLHPFNIRAPTGMWSNWNGLRTEAKQRAHSAPAPCALRERATNVMRQAHFLREAGNLHLYVKYSIYNCCFKF